MRKECKECPWKNTNQHDLKFRKYFDKMKSLGKVSHRCHMISSDVWGDTSDKNVCIGQQNQKNEYNNL